MSDITTSKLVEIPVEHIVNSIRRMYTSLGMDQRIKFYITAAQLRQVQKFNPELFDEKNFRILGYIVDLIAERPKP